ncbi:MAG: septal ring lytic transglycosylase RlpA family protein [Magnetococcales bacterium]|nr:septal ring lytic transglycosylase RlpA family protein [Magnetococcales bacterium]
MPIWLPGQNYWLIGLLAAALLASGCATRVEGPEDIPPDRSAPLPPRVKLKPTERPYSISGVRYVPMLSAEGYREKGVASWYGPGFHGRDTANGEDYDQDELTAAHTTLPLPTMVRVTDLNTGKSVDVRVNDRGPFVKNRLIDLSRGAARALGFFTQGTAMVEVVALGPGEPQTQLARAKRKVKSTPEVGKEDAPKLFVQIGAFQSENNARRLAKTLEERIPVRVTRAEVSDQTFYRVQLGPLASVEMADGLVESLAGRGLGEGRIVVE